MNAQQAPGPSLSGIRETNLEKAQAIFDETMGARTPDPLELYRKYRETYGDFVPGHGRDFPDGYTIPAWFEVLDAPSLMTSSHAAIREIFFSTDRFSGELHNPGDGEEGKDIVHMEGKDHRRMRVLLGQGLSPRSVATWEDRMVRPVVQKLLDSCCQDSSVDLIRGFARPLPSIAMMSLLDLPQEHFELFDLLTSLMVTTLTSEDGKNAAIRLAEYFASQLEQRRSLGVDELARREDIISLMATASENEDVLSDEEIVGSLNLLLVAGFDTTYRAMSNLVFCLAEDAELYDRVRHEREKVPDLIEEMLRFYPPVTLNQRIALQDTEVCGVSIPKGQQVFLNQLLANRDPEVYEDPETFNIDREKKPHLSFGFGPHICAGMHLSKLELKVGIDEILDRYSSLKWDPAYPKPIMQGCGLRSSSHLHVLLD